MLENFGFVWLHLHVARPSSVRKVAIWVPSRLICGDNCLIAHTCAIGGKCCLFNLRLPTNLPLDRKILRSLESVGVSICSENGMAWLMTIIVPCLGQDQESEKIGVWVGNDCLLSIASRCRKSLWWQFLLLPITSTFHLFHIQVSEKVWVWVPSWE